MAGITGKLVIRYELLVIRADNQAFTTNLNEYRQSTYMAGNELFRGGDF